jgi:hypothetical protein
MTNTRSVLFAVPAGSVGVRFAGPAVVVVPAAAGVDAATNVTATRYPFAIV